MDVSCHNNPEREVGRKHISKESEIGSGRLLTCMFDHRLPPAQSPLLKTPALLEGQPFFHHLANCVQQKLVSFLDASRDITRYQKLDVCDTFALASTPAKKRDGVEFGRLCFLESPTNIFTLATGCKDSQHVAWFPKCLYLPGE